MKTSTVKLYRTIIYVKYAINTKYGARLVDDRTLTVFRHILLTETWRAEHSLRKPRPLSHGSVLRNSW